MRIPLPLVVTATVAATVALVAPGPSDPVGAAAPAISAVVVGPTTADAPITITVRVSDPDPSGVVLDWVADFGAPVALTMADDGTSGDGAAGDGTYGVVTPARPADTLVRYRIRSGAAVLPAQADGRRYEGYVVAPTPVDTVAPVLDWRIAPADYAWLRANPDSKDYRPSVLVAGGVVYDGVEVRPQGGVTAQTGPKPNFKLKLPKQRRLAAPIFEDPVDELVMDADFEDPTYSVNVVGNELYARHGVPPRQVTTARVQRNGTFHGVYQLLEEVDDGEWRDRVGYEVASAYGGETSRAFLIDEGSPELLEGRFEQEHPDEGGNGDLAELVAALDGVPSDQRLDVVADRFDLPRLVDLLAASTILQNWDTVSGNYSLISDEATGRWQIVPNDLDLILGLRGRTRNQLLLPGMALGTMSPLFGEPRFLEMYHRRVRTLLDTELTADRILDRVDQNLDPLRPDIALDRAAWPLGLPSPDAGRADVADYVAFARSRILAHERPGEVPGPQDPSATVAVSEVRHAGPTSGDFVELANPSEATAVDVSGWTLEGAATATLPGGSVVPAGTTLVVPTDPAAVAAREEGTFVAGRLSQDLPGAGTLTVRDASGAARDTITWSSGGDWPTPGPGGGSLEAVVLDGGRSQPDGWRVADEVDGSPGVGWPATDALEASVWTGRWNVPRGAAVDVRMSVTNRGATPLSGLAARSGDPACDRDLGTLAPGQSRSWWCRTTLSSSRASAAVTLRATAADGSVGAAATVIPLDGFTLAAPVLRSVTMAAGGLRLDHGDAGAPSPSGEPTILTRWRMEAQLSTPDGPRPTSRLVAPTGPSLVDVPDGVPTRARVTGRTTLALGVPSATSPAIVPRAEPWWPFASPAALVDRWHRDLGGGPPPAPVAALWVAAIEAGTPPAQLAADLLAQPRWRGEASDVARLYLATLGRVPDAPGLDFWIARRSGGASLREIAAFFARSPEFVARYGDLGGSAFVDRLYRNVFGRASDATGLAYWTERLRQGESRGNVVTLFSASPEGVQRLGPRTDVALAWYALAGVDAPAEAVRDGAAWLAAGGSPMSVVDAVRSTDTYRTSLD